MDDDSLSLDEKQERALAIGREYLGVENGHIERVVDEKTHEVVASVGDGPALPEGKLLERATTYCRRTLAQDAPLALSNAGEQGWAEDPAYEEHGFDCYLGATIRVDGEAYGTVCFLSREPRSREFAPTERAFVELLARMLGREIEQHRHERALARSEEKYRALVEAAPVAMFLAEADTGRIVEVNEQAVELSGYERSELLGMAVFELNPTEQAERYRELLQRLERTGEYRDRFDDGTPLRMERPDGSTVPIEMNTQTVELDHGQYVQGLVRDISDRRERERELQRHRDFLKQTQEAASVGGWEVDFRSGALRWTDEVRRIHGLPLDYEPTVEEALDFYHPEDRPEIEAALDRLRADGEPYDLELRVVTADGETRWVRAIGLPREEGGEVVGARGVFQDVTDRTERERELRIKDRAIEAVDTGITIADATEPDYPLVYANSGFEELTGYDQSVALGRNCRFLQGKATDPERTEEIREALEAERSMRTELLNYRADGTPFWNELSLTPVTGSDGEVTHYVGIQRDRTREKRREQLIGVLNRVLRHNLRNDMNVVITLAQLLAARTDGEEAAFAERIVGTAEELVAHSEKARTLEDAVNDPRQRRRIDAAAAVRTAADRTRGRQDGTVTVDAPDEQPVRATDRLIDAVAELATNALTHGADRVRLSVEDSGATTLIRVSDDGPGLDPAEARVLEQGNETPLKHGSGLGLFMIRWFVTGFGGSVSVDADDGTTVTIRLSGVDGGPGRRSADRRLPAAISSE